MKVQAIKPGFYGGDLKSPGDIFEVPDGSKAMWFVPASGPEAGNDGNAGNVRGAGSRRSSGTKPGPEAGNEQQ